MKKSHRKVNVPRLNSRIIEKGLTTLEVTQAAGLGPNYIWKIRHDWATNSNSNPLYKNMLRIAKVLDISITELYMPKKSKVVKPELTYDEDLFNPNNQVLSLLTTIARESVNTNKKLDIIKNVMSTVAEKNMIELKLCDEKQDNTKFEDLSVDEMIKHLNLKSKETGNVLPKPAGTEPDDKFEGNLKTDEMIDRLKDHAVSVGLEPVKPEPAPKVKRKMCTIDGVTILNPDSELASGKIYIKKNICGTTSKQSNFPKELISGLELEELRKQVLLAQIQVTEKMKWSNTYLWNIMIADSQLWGDIKPYDSSGMSNVLNKSDEYPGVYMKLEISFYLLKKYA